MGYKEVVFSVPSGNFGNIGAGLLAWKMGLPVRAFLAATNVNDTVPIFLQTGLYQAKPSVQTRSNAMDVGDPSNWVRIMDLFKGDRSLIKNLLSASSFNDDETLEAIKLVYKEHDYIMCPHTAIAWLALSSWMNNYNSDEIAGIFLATAHPCKFPDIFPADIASKIDVPEQVKGLEAKERVFTSLGNKFEGFKAYLLG
jgi:threonine synthase